MESSKRKRTADDARNGGDQRKLRRGSGEERGRKEGDRDRDRDRDRRAAAAATEAVNDAEVEEFYAILQRARAASRGIAVGDAVRRLEAERFRWRPAFVWEDFEGGAAAVKDDGREGKEVSSEDKEEEEEEVRVRGLELDLNADPDPDPDPDPEGGDPTARCAGMEA